MNGGTVRASVSRGYVCRKCGADSWYKKASGSYRCAECVRIRSKERYYLDPEKVKTRAREWRENNPERRRRNSRAWALANPDAVLAAHLKHRFGVPLGVYQKHWEEQGGRCAICGVVCSSGRRLALDHSHETGHVRGLLCMNCNNGLGRFKDSPERLRAAASYLEERRANCA